MFYKEGVGENTTIHVKLCICVNLFINTHLWKDHKKMAGVTASRWDWGPGRQGCGEVVTLSLEFLLGLMSYAFKFTKNNNIIKEIVNSSEIARSKIDKGASNLWCGGQAWEKPTECRGNNQRDRPKRRTCLKDAAHKSYHPSMCTVLLTV